MSGSAKTGSNPKFSIELENGGILRGELYPRFAPQTVGNFAALANAGRYDGSAFHRCIRDYLIQGGDLALGYGIPGEFEFNGFKQNKLPCGYGVLGMSRGTGYDSACSQFFVVLTQDERELSCIEGAYALFGRVTEGLELAFSLSMCPTDVNDAPLQRQGIKRVRVETLGQSYPFTKLAPQKAQNEPL